MTALPARAEISNAQVISSSRGDGAVRRRSQLKPDLPVGAHRFAEASISRADASSCLSYRLMHFYDFNEFLPAARSRQGWGFPPSGGPAEPGWAGTPSQPPIAPGARQKFPGIKTGAADERAVDVFCAQQTLCFSGFTEPP